MSTKARYGLFAFTGVLVLALLACGLPASATPGSDATTVAMQVQLTMQAIQNATLAAQVAQGGQPTQEGQLLPTYTPLPTYTQPVPTEIIPTPKQNIADRINSAKFWFTKIYI